MSAIYKKKNFNLKELDNLINNTVIIIQDIRKLVTFL